MTLPAVTPESYSGIYAEIAAQLGCESAERLFELLRGQMIVFPQKLYSREYVHAFIREHCAEYSVRELARLFDYSDRRIRQIIAEEKETGRQL